MIYKIQFQIYNGKHNIKSKNNKLVPDRYSSAEMKTCTLIYVCLGFFFRTHRLLITEKKENKIDLVLCTIYVYISALAYNANPAYIGYTFVQRKKEKTTTNDNNNIRHNQTSAL